MSAIRFGRGQGYQFFRQEDIRRNWDLRTAVQFLNGFRADAVAMANFRRQVKKEITASPANLSDEQVIRSLARMMVSGEFMVALPERQHHRDPLELRAPVTAPSAPRESTPVEVVEDEPTFANDHDGVAQAAVLIEAARGAFPFCAECAKYAAEQQANKPVAKQASDPPSVKQTSNKPAAEQDTSQTAAKQETNAASAPPAGNRPPDEQGTNPPVAKQETNQPAAKQESNPPIAKLEAGSPIAKQGTASPEAKQETPAPPAQQQAVPLLANQPPAAKAVEKETYWVEIALIGEDGQPVPGEEFIVELPDGKRETGFLDGNGLARFSELSTSGNCKVSFPQLDRDAWQLVPQNRK